MRNLIAIEEKKPNKSSLHISWFLHNNCNFHCSYCWDINHDGKYKAPPLEKVTTFLTSVFESYKEKDLIHFSFTGGEPTLWPDFEHLCRFLRKNNCYIGMTTNGSRSKVFWNRASSYFNWICLSYHPEKSDPKMIIENIEEIRQRTQLTIRIMMHPSQGLWNKALDFSKMVTDDPEMDWIRVEFVPIQEVLGSNEGKFFSYSVAQKDFFNRHAIFERFTPDKKPPLLNKCVDLWSFNEVYDDGEKKLLNSNELIIKDLHHFCGWECRCGRDLLFIDHKQDIWRATCHAGGLVGNVYDSEISFPQDPVICKEKACVCETDLQIPKCHSSYKKIKQDE